MRTSLALLFPLLVSLVSFLPACGARPVDLDHLETLSFAIVGDTRPPVEDDTAAYPTPIIQAIWQDVEAADPRPAFAVATGDYVFASPSGGEAAAQIDLYLGARAAFSGPVFPALGNHECTGATDSNCGPGTTNGITANYAAFLSRMLAPIGVPEPYYVVHAASAKGAWTAKLVVLAANAWTDDQAAWLSTALAEPTTYTFVVRHEPAAANTAPGVVPSEAILRQYPVTLLIAGHTHTFETHLDSREIVVGNGGAPLSGAVGYGYVIARQRADGAMAFQAYDYDTNVVVTSFAVSPEGVAEAY